MPREFKCYGLRPSPKPTRWQAKLSSTVQVLDEQGRPGYAYVNFSPPLLVRVGKALARGISERNPAFLRVEYSAHFRQWLIAAQYLDDSEVAILWREKKQPTWLRIHYPRAFKTKETA